MDNEQENKDLLISEKMKECFQGQQPHYCSFFFNGRQQLTHLKWSTVELFFEIVVEITISFWHVELPDPSRVVHENVGFDFNIGDSATIR